MRRSLPPSLPLSLSFFLSLSLCIQVSILENTHLFSGNTEKNGICEVLYAAAWIVGEFSEFLSDPRGVIDSLLNPKITALPGHIQAVFVQNIVKLYAAILVKAEAQVHVHTHTCVQYMYTLVYVYIHVRYTYVCTCTCM